MTKTLLQKVDRISAVVVWDRDYYIRQTEKELVDQDIYEEDPGPIISTIHMATEQNLGKKQPPMQVQLNVLC